MKTQLITWAHALHQIPEIGLQEYETTKYLMKELTQMGYNPQQCLDTGCYVYIDQKKDKTIAFRSDIDGLAIKEESCHPTPSTRQGFMHACGHDGHMAMLLGLAKSLKDKVLPYNVLLIFQPAEEYPGGARLIVEEGILEKCNVKAIFGFHLSPSVNKGEITFRSGPMMAECGELNITVTGKSAHAGLPHEGVDTLLVSSQLINHYQSIITKRISPTEPALIHIGQMYSGTARNIVSEKTEMHGTIRVFSEEMFDKVVSEMKAINEGLERMHGCRIELSCPPMYPPVINDEKLSQWLLTILHVNSLNEPVMLAEDFSFYQKEIPGVFMFLGTKTEDYQYPLHSSHFYFEEDILEKGLETYLKIINTIEL